MSDAICSACGKTVGETFNCEVCAAFNKNEAIQKINSALAQMDYHGGVALVEELTDSLSKSTERTRNVTDFVTRYMVNNGDNFYTPYENTFDSHEEAVKDYNDKWNQNRRSGDDLRGGTLGDGSPDPGSCGEAECDHPEHEGAHSKMRSYLELPYGHICSSCGGSMIALIQLDEHKNPLKTLLIDCG